MRTDTTVTNKINTIRRKSGNTLGRCPTCGKAPMFAYVLHDAGGKIYEACVDAAHAEHLPIFGAYRDWFFRPEAIAIRRRTLDALNA